MIAKTETFEIRTPGRGSYEITGEVARILAASGLKEGIVTVFVRHTSASLVIYENADPSAREDLHEFLDRIAPDGEAWHIHTAEGPDDTASHLRMTVTRTSETIPVTGGRMALGTWQGIFLLEHRLVPHRREIVVSDGGCLAKPPRAQRAQRRGPGLAQQFDCLPRGHGSHGRLAVVARVARYDDLCAEKNCGGRHHGILQIGKPQIEGLPELRGTRRGHLDKIQKLADEFPGSAVHQVMQVGQRVPGRPGATGVARRVIENRGAVGKVGMAFQKDVEQHVAIEEEAHLQSVFGPQLFEAGSALARQLAASGPPGREGPSSVTARRLFFNGLLQKIGDQAGKGGAPPLGRLFGPVVDRRIQGHGDAFFHYAYDIELYVFCQPGAQARKCCFGTRVSPRAGSIPVAAGLHCLIEAVDGPDKLPPWRALPK